MANALDLAPTPSGLGETKATTASAPSRIKDSPLIAHQQQVSSRVNKRLHAFTRPPVDLDPSATCGGYATDVIAVLAKDGKRMHCTDLNVRFRRRAGKGKEKKSDSGMPVAFFVDDLDVPALELRLTREHLCK
jgi:hypothetical protein